jgi:hypothetical protein
VRISMDNLNCVQWIGSEWNVTEKGLVQNLDSRDISQIGPFGDMSDGVRNRFAVAFPPAAIHP